MREMLEKNRRMLVYLVASNFLLFFGFRVWQTLFNNFAVEKLGIGPWASAGLSMAPLTVPVAQAGGRLSPGRWPGLPERLVAGYVA